MKNLDEIINTNFSKQSSALHNLGFFGESIQSKIYDFHQFDTKAGKIMGF